MQDEEIETLIELCPDLEELFDTLDITIFEVVQALVKHGYVELPEYVTRRAYETEETET